ncbi:GATA zinc finger domain-containing protein, putative [Babesia caballi]|uniref:GATA zinc finger domain-containing protein, putative n=1 Tax=Babesia caballi TaxID=5871 RepID=A0AAV4LM35_BABCB|nr:GATA zinc finger domain-containing protein, putative [Babesia caballi]
MTTFNDPGVNPATGYEAEAPSADNGASGDLVSHTPFATSGGVVGDSAEASNYDVSHTSTTAGYLESSESYYGESAAAPNAHEAADAPISNQMQPSLLPYDVPVDYSAGQSMAPTCYDDGMMDPYAAYQNGMGYPGPMPGPMSSGMPGSMSSGMPGPMPSGMPGPMPPPMHNSMAAPMPASMPSGMTGAVPSGMPASASSGMHGTMPAGDPSMDAMGRQYWYGRTPGSTMYSKPIVRYGGGYHGYGPVSPYYPCNGPPYNSYTSERSLPYTGAYHMPNDAYMQGKMPYPPAYGPRRAISTGALPAQCNTSPLNCYRMLNDQQMPQLQYKGCKTHPPSMHDGVDTSPISGPSMMHPQSHEPVAPRLNDTYNPDPFFSELTLQLQNELKNKKPLMPAGRPRVNRHNYVCAMCNAKTTPQWRYIKGTSVCNACYMRIRKQKLREQQRQEKEEEEVGRSDAASAETEAPVEDTSALQTKTG